jgi:hypothetical protein
MDMFVAALIKNAPGGSGVSAAVSLPAEIDVAALKMNFRAATVPRH